MKKVLVVGGGLGGISAAIYLAAEGYEVELFEKNAQIGDKLNFLEKEGFRFDLGPSILTMPHIFDALFKQAGRKVADYFTLKPVNPHWRNFLEDGQVIDLVPFDEENHFRVTNVSLEDKRQLEEFLTYSKKLYDYTEKGYFSEGLDRISDNLKFYGPMSLLKDFDALSTMDTKVRKYIDNPYLVDIMNFFSKYVGSSPYNAPALLNLLPCIQYEFGLWYVDGGMYNLARGLNRLLEELGVNVHLNTEVKKIIKNQNQVDAIQLEDGQRVEGDIIVSNMEVVPACEKLLDMEEEFIEKFDKFEPTCSGLVIHLGLKEEYSQLAHHNFFFSKDPKTHFSSIYDKKKMPSDPTLYVVAPTRTDASQAPAGYDNLKILPHIPYITQDVTQADYDQLKETVYTKLKKMGLTNLRENIIFEEILTPFDLQEMYYSNKGSIYGVVSDRNKNLGLKIPKKIGVFDNLYFVGGSVNPGGGMPMVVLSGINAAKDIIKDE